MALISLIHPSRGRADKSASMIKEWKDSAGCEVEVIVSLDNSDLGRYQYYRTYDQYNHPIHRVSIIESDNTCVVEATNVAAEKSTSDILVYTSDDFKSFNNWGLSVLKEFEGEDRPLLLKVDDMLQKFDVPVLTIPIMNRALYERLGYFWHPEYKSMFVDEDLYWTTRKLGALKFAPHLKFEHQHVSVGKAQDDETYRNSAKNWDQGKAVFAKRKAAGFPI